MKLKQKSLDSFFKPKRSRSPPEKPAAEADGKARSLQNKKAAQQTLARNLKPLQTRLAPR